MSAHIEDSVHGFSNEQLIEHYYLEKSNYTEEALTAMKQELRRRAISQEKIDAVITALTAPDSEESEYMAKHYDKSEYETIDGRFTANDVLIVRAMLAEHEIPLMIDMSEVAAMSGIQAKASHPVTLLVHRDFIEQARKLIAEHFDLNEEMYVLKYNDTLSRLKAFNFYEVPPAILVSSEITAVELSPAEKDILIAFGRRLLDEVDAIEAEQERVIFYYDAVEPLIEQLEKPEKPKLLHTDLLASLEILQIYCSDPGFSGEALGIADALLHFFAGQAS
jgi:hypothetical protein